MLDVRQSDIIQKGEAMEERFIGIELRSINNAVRRYLEQTAADLIQDRITCSNAWIIGYLTRAEGDVFQKDLENEFGITRSTASKALILLEKKGVIRRESVPQDARLKKLILTEKGYDISEALKRNGSRMEKQLTRGFTEEELSALAGYLARIRENIDTIEARSDDK